MVVKIRRGKRKSSPFSEEDNNKRQKGYKREIRNEFSDVGHLVSTTEYLDGKKDGVQILYQHDLTLDTTFITVCHYVQDKLVGEWKRYESPSHLSVLTTTKNTSNTSNTSTGKLVEEHLAGKLIEEHQYTDGNLNYSHVMGQHDQQTWWELGRTMTKSHHVYNNGVVKTVVKQVNGEEKVQIWIPLENENQLHLSREEISKDGITVRCTGYTSSGSVSYSFEYDDKGQLLNK